MGALLTAAVPRLRATSEPNRGAREAVVSPRVSFINAGAELIETNTFGANRRKLAANYLEDQLEAINGAAVKLARQARETTGRDVFIAGSIGPIGEPAAPRVRQELFAEQAAVLEGRGADLFMLETFYDLDELVDAIAAVRGVSSLPIVALLTFDEGAETLAGVTAKEAADRLSELDLAAIGANHGAGLLAALTALEEMQGDGRVLAALPNIGLASLSGGRVIYPHATADEQSGNVRFVDINDNATARAGMSSLMVSGAIERATGLEAIPHLTTRDWTVLGLESMLLGAHAEGVRNILAITGDPPEVGDYPGARGVYEVDSIGLTLLMANLNRGEDFNGRPIDAPTSFFPGVAVNPTADDVELELDRFRQKVEAGAKFAITQIVFDLDRFDDFTERLGGRWPIPVLIEVFPLTSHRLALRLHNELPGDRKS